MDTRGWLMTASVLGTMLASAAQAEPRPQASALRLDEAAVLARFTPDVRASRSLQDRALALWRLHFAAQAAEVERRFVSEEDWRPALADAAELIDEYLEASLLPRHGEWRADGVEGQAGKVWVEKLDPRTGQRVRTLREARPRVRLLAPVDRGAEGDGKAGAGGKVGAPRPAATPAR